MKRYKLTVDGNRGLLESDSPITDRDRECLEGLTTTTSVFPRDSHALVVMKPTLLGWSGIASAMEVFLPGIWECDLPSRPEETPPAPLPEKTAHAAATQISRSVISRARTWVSGNNQDKLAALITAIAEEWLTMLLRAGPAVTREWACKVAVDIVEEQISRGIVRRTWEHEARAIGRDAILHNGHLVEPPKSTRPLDQVSLERIAAEFNEHYPPGTSVFVTYDGGRQAFETIRRPAYAADGYVRVVTSDIDIVTLDRIVPIPPPAVPTLEKCDEAVEIIGNLNLCGNSAASRVRAAIVIHEALTKQASQPPVTERYTDTLPSQDGAQDARGHGG